MERKVIVACDSFKGCLDSMEAGRAVASGFSGSGVLVRVMPLADGGEGMAESVARCSKGWKRISLPAVDPLGRKVRAFAWCHAGSGDVCLDMAAASGLTLLSPDELDPMKTSTAGTGEMIRRLLDICCGRVILGLGGSATNDAGLGALWAMGADFMTSDGIMTTAPAGKDLRRIADFDLSRLASLVDGRNFTLAVDVDSPFTGQQGAARVFAPQKGASPDAVEILEEGMKHICRVIERETGIDLDSVSGSGAAGGMAGGMLALLGKCGAHVSLERGVDIVLDAVDFDRELVDADFVVTGEGHADRQTLMGKAAFGVLKRCRQMGKNVVLLAGIVDDMDQLLNAGFSRVIDINAGFPAVCGDPLDPAVAAGRLRIASSRL